MTTLRDDISRLRPVRAWVGGVPLEGVMADAHDRLYLPFALPPGMQVVAFEIEGPWPEDAAS